MVLSDNTPDVVVKSLLEGGSATRGVSHRHLLPLLAAHASDLEQPMLLFPKTVHGSLKSLLLHSRTNQRLMPVSSSCMQPYGVCVKHVAFLVTSTPTGPPLYVNNVGKSSIICEYYSQV